MEVPSASQSTQEIAIKAIDQAVVDGLVDGAERWVQVGTLLGIGFGMERPDKSQFVEFCSALAEDERYLDRVRNRYSFLPTLSPESTVRASLVAIVGGTALCSEQERGDAMRLMNYFAEKVYARSNNRTGILSLREVSYALNDTIGNITFQEFGAFLHFMRQDPRFFPMDDGRIALTETPCGNTNQVAELSKTADLASVVEGALPYLFTNPRGVFTEGALLGTLKRLGVYLRADQIGEVFEQLRLLPQVQSFGNGRYKLIKDSSKTPGKEPKEHQPSLEAMLNGALGGGTRHKPHDRKKGGSRRRIVDM